MLDAKLLDDFSAKFAALTAAVPVKDVEKNLRALFSSVLERLDLVTREEFDRQRQGLVRAQEKLAALEARVAELESRAGAAKR